VKKAEKPEWFEWLRRNIFTIEPVGKRPEEEVEALRRLNKDHAMVEALAPIACGLEALPRINALRFLGWLGDSSAYPVVLKSLSHEDAETRLVALWALNSLNPKESASDFAKRVAELGKTGSEAFAAPLLSLLHKTESKEMRLACIRALGDLGVERAGIYLNSLLQAEKDAEVKGAIQEALTKILRSGKTMPEPNGRERGPRGRPIPNSR